MKKAIDNARKLTTKPLLVRLDSAHDSIDTLVTLGEAKKVSFVVKWNLDRSASGATKNGASAKAAFWEILSRL